MQGSNGYLLSGATVSGAGDSMDCRYTLNYAYLFLAAGNSAVLKLEASHDATGWLPVATFTAVAASGSAQISAFYPYVRGVFVTGWANSTGFMHYAPGLQRL